MVYVWCMYGVCMVYVWCMYGVCMVYVWCMYGVCMVYVWCMRGVCVHCGKENAWYVWKRLRNVMIKWVGADVVIMVRKGGWERVSTEDTDKRIQSSEMSRNLRG
jgi:hypothetical protein